MLNRRPRDRDWVRLPTDWVRDGRLSELRWGQGHGSDGTAALMLLAVIAHHADAEAGIASLTYDELVHHAGLSRAKVSRGLAVLEKMELLTRPGGRSVYVLAGYDKRRGWGKLPSARLYNADGEIAFFHELKLRSRVELDALKLWLLFVAMRSDDTNDARISYAKITEYSGIERNAIRCAISLLILNGLVHVDRMASMNSAQGFANVYRLPQIESRIHPGTRIRDPEMLSDLLA